MQEDPIFSGGPFKVLIVLLFAAALLAPEHAEIATALEAFRARQTDDVMSNDDPRQPASSAGHKV